VIGGFAAVGLLSRIYRFPFLPVIDAIAPGLVLAQAIGRLGCIVTGDAWGAPTSSPMAFIYTNSDAMLPQNLLVVPTHPYPLYDMAINLLVFVAIWHLRTRRLPDGMLFAAFVALYAPGRFLVSFVREERIWVWGLQEAQIIALIALTGALLALGWFWRQTHGATRPRPALVRK
jgi:phosphatidylglycerol:prolipoprotein diacylglycerol transferase